jgi:outer membrane protein OmpA-like peptidoglycan-associated protein
VLDTAAIITFWKVHAMTKWRLAAIAFAVATPLAVGGAAIAADPSVDDILSALKPKAGALTGTTRGIRAVAPSSAPASSSPSARRVAMVAPVASTEAPSLDLTIVFRSGSAELTPAATATLTRLGKAMANPSLAAYRFRIEGHTDTIGTPEGNKALSQARAEKVASFLESDFGVSASRLEAVGMGEEGLLVATPDQTAEPRNRRVHVVNLGG